MPGLWFEEFEVGQEYTTAERTVSMADLEAFAEVSRDRNPLHLDEEYARQTVFGGRIAQGVLGLAIATGLLNQRGLTRGTLVALLGVRWDFRAAVRPGDTLRGEIRVDETRPARRGEAGVVGLEMRLLNQRGEVTQEGVLTLLVRRRP